MNRNPKRGHFSTWMESMPILAAIFIFFFFLFFFLLKNQYDEDYHAVSSVISYYFISFDFSFTSYCVCTLLLSRELFASFSPYIGGFAGVGS